MYRQLRVVSRYILSSVLHPKPNIFTLNYCLINIKALDGYPASLGFLIMHQVHVICTQSFNNYHQIKSFHPPVKPYTTTHHNTVYIPVYNLVFIIPKSQWQGPRCALFCALYRPTAGQCPPHDTPLEVSPPPYLPSSHAPPLLHSSAPLLPPVFPSLRPCLRSFLTRSLPQPPPSSTPALTLPHIIASSIDPPYAPSLTTLPLLPSSHLHSSSALPCLPAYLPVCFPLSNSMYTVCLLGKLHCKRLAIA